ncbi:MAG: transcription factor IIB [Nitrosopumilaceae archaeon]|nr:transcription factor IIB [Nitrosopumilaceae archaeon]NIU00741.1 transcription factor IIB [Nitrosopumilaceae archaeon]NIU87173.1 transcription factor IIB [Nitrosopumilaceae archaeon]NIV65700.1 transcription factor IIB [Nitrosopumilaceae archaeon]NIX61343.1 transcription factor IIB [Nitrosopumilaceae archaeon]
MNTIETQCCPECSSALVDDIQNGEIICSGCGVVVADQMEDYGPESKSSDLEERMRLARATGQTTYSQHDLGISTEISISAKDFSGKSINSEVANQMHNLRKWQQRVRVSSPRERRLANVLTKIGEGCQNISLPKNVLETSSMIYRNLDEVLDVKGKSVVSISAATIYMACKQCEVVRSLEEICRGICAPKDVKTKTKLAARYYRTMVMEMGSVKAPVVTMDRYISKIANMTQTEARVERLALEISSKTKDNSIADGKAPNGIAAAYLYIASVLLGQNVLQRDVSSIAGVTEVTIRNRCKEILTNYKLKITLRPSLARQ